MGESIAKNNPPLPPPYFHKLLKLLRGIGENYEWRASIGYSLGALYNSVTGGGGVSDDDG